MDQWKIIENPDWLIHIKQLIFDKDVEIIQWRKENLFNKWYSNNWISIQKKMKFNPYFTPLTKINCDYSLSCMCNCDYSLSCTITMTLLKENQRVWSWFWSRQFLSRLHKAITIKENKLTTWASSKLKLFLIKRHHFIKKMKGKTQIGKKYWQNNIAIQHKLLSQEN